MGTDYASENARLNGPDLTSEALAAYLPRVTWINGAPWKIKERILSPVAMPHVTVTVNRKDIRKAMRREGAILAVWTSHWDELPTSEWWWTCCDATDYSIANIESSRGRRSIRKGLRDCTVRRVEAQSFGSLAYSIYSKAVMSYGHVPPSEKEYCLAISKMAEYPGTEFWGSFVGDILAAFSTCQIIDGAVTLGSTKSDPALDKHNPSAALFYTIANYYLDQGLGYVSNGSRTLWHPTRINEFLQTLGFRRIYCHVNVEASVALRCVGFLNPPQWGRYLGLPQLLGTRWKRLEGFCLLARIARGCV